MNPNISDYNKNIEKVTNVVILDNNDIEIFFKISDKKYGKKLLTYSKFGKNINNMLNIIKRDLYLYQNYYEDIDKDTVKMILLFKEKYYEVFFDREDFIKIDSYVWSIQINKSNNKPYVRNVTVGFLQRYLLLDGEIFDNKKQDKIVDHLNRDTLNNKRINLRIVNNSLNQRNKSIQRNNTSGIIGVKFLSGINSWQANIVDLNGKRKSKSFSINKYGYEKAKELAIEYRNKYEKIYGYIKEGSTTIESIS